MVDPAMPARMEKKSEAVACGGGHVANFRALEATSPWGTKAARRRMRRQRVKQRKLPTYTVHFLLAARGDTVLCKRYVVVQQIVKADDIEHSPQDWNEAKAHFEAAEGEQAMGVRTGATEEIGKHIPDCVGITTSMPEQKQDPGQHQEAEEELALGGMDSHRESGKQVDTVLNGNDSGDAQLGTEMEPAAMCVGGSHGNDGQSNSVEMPGLRNVASSQPTSCSQEASNSEVLHAVPIPATMTLSMLDHIEQVIADMLEGGPLLEDELLDEYFYELYPEAENDEEVMVAVYEQEPRLQQILRMLRARGSIQWKDSYIERGRIAHGS